MSRAEAWGTAFYTLMVIGLLLYAYWPRKGGDNGN